MLIELEQQIYEIIEDGSNDTLQICAILTGEIETLITATLTSVNITATRKCVNIYLGIYTVRAYLFK